jgi:hypothetical protein
MPELTPSFLMQYEREMRAITETEYARRLAGEHQWASKVLRTSNIQKKAERVTWLLNTAYIEPVGPSGSGVISFEDLVTQTVEYPVLRHGKGIKVQRDQIEDLDGTGLNALAEWSSEMGNEMAYYPQRLASQLILNGANTNGSANAYDGLPFFSDNSAPHLNNPFKASSGNYANWLHGAASGSYPGALPIDDSVATDVALTNLGKAISYVAGFKMPNGIDPRFLSPKLLICPPRMAPRVRELTKAKFIAQIAASGAGSGDVEALIRGWALGEPIVAQEFAASTTYNFQTAVANPTTGQLSTVSATASGSDTSWYLVCQENQSSTLGGLLHIMRKPFKITYYTGDSGGTGLDAILDRANELEYHCQGRMSCQYGHPYAVIRIDAS